MGLFWLHQKNPCNTQPLWSSIVGSFNTDAQLRGREVHNFVENCSAHSIDYTVFGNYRNHFLPPNMTSVLQPVDCAVGRSFKFALRRLIVTHVIDFVDRQLELPEAERQPLKINKVITAYVALKLIAEAWDLVRRRVIFKAWLKTGILSPHQFIEVEDLLAQHKTTIWPALKPRRGTATSMEEAANSLRCAAVAKTGSDWLDKIAEAESPASGDESARFDEEELWDMDNMASLRAATSTLQSRDQFADVSVDMLETLFEAEDISLTSEPISEEDALSASVQPTSGDVGEGSDDKGLEDASNSTRGSSVCSFVRAAEQLSEELQLLMAESHDIGGEGCRHSLLRLVEGETRKAREWLQTSRNQTQITDFFRSGGS